MNPDDIATLLPHLNPSERRELLSLVGQLERSKARESLLTFTQATLPTYAPASHHQQIAEALEAVERGQIKRALISLPPRGGKSELVSRRFPPWVMGRNPNFEFIAASYSSQLANDFSRDVRGIVQDETFAVIFPKCRLKTENVEFWETSNGCKYRPVGVEGPATGRGADGFLIDDPVKDRLEADSEIRRQRTWNWYRSTAYTRLSKDGWIIICQTRWNEQDLTGMVLEAMDQGGEQWEQIIVPAIDPKGRSFWPERFPIERLDMIKRTIGGREWASLYQQTPTPDEGTYFQRDWFKRFRTGDEPKRLNRYMTSDHAVSEDKGDYTVLRVWGVDAGGDLYMLDGYRGQVTADKWMEQAVDLIKRHKPLCWFPENDQAFRTAKPFIMRYMREQKVGCRIEELSTAGDKAAKARSFQAMASMGRVHLPMSVEADEVVGEYLRFPAGKHDDEVDAAAHMGRALDMAHPAIIPVTEKVDGPTDIYARSRRRENAGDGFYS